MSIDAGVRRRVLAVGRLAQRRVLADDVVPGAGLDQAARRLPVGGRAEAGARVEDVRRHAVAAVLAVGRACTCAPPTRRSARSPGTCPSSRRSRRCRSGNCSTSGRIHASQVRLSGGRDRERGARRNGEVLARAVEVGGLIAVRAASPRRRVPPWYVPVWLLPVRSGSRPGELVHRPVGDRAVGEDRLVVAARAARRRPALPPAPPAPAAGTARGAPPPVPPAVPPRAATRARRRSRPRRRRTGGARRAPPPAAPPARHPRPPPPRRPPPPAPPLPPRDRRSAAPRPRHRRCRRGRAARSGAARRARGAARSRRRRSCPSHRPRRRCRSCRPALRCRSCRHGPPVPAVPPPPPVPSRRARSNLHIRSGQGLPRSRRLSGGSFGLQVGDSKATRGGQTPPRKPRAVYEPRPA